MNRRDYDPWTGMLSLREAMNRLLEESVVTAPAARGSWRRDGDAARYL